MKQRLAILFALSLAAIAALAAAPESLKKAFPDECDCTEETIIAELMASSPAARTSSTSILSPFIMNAAFNAPQSSTTTNKHTQTYTRIKSTKSKSLPTKVKTQFAWGGDAGASIDLSGNDMSSIDLSMSFGLRHGWLNFLGLGAGADIAVTNSTRAYPFFLDFRTNLTNRPTVCFWQLRLGGAYNMLEHNHQQMGIYGNTGIGVNLARGKKFCSHLILCYTYRQRKQVIGPEMTHNFTDLHFASVKIGVTF